MSELASESFDSEQTPAGGPRGTRGPHGGKEKFEVIFMAGGALLDVLRNRLRRPAADPRETIGAAMHELTARFLQDRDELRDPNGAARKLFLIREDLCAAEPDRAAVSRHIKGFTELVAPNPALAARASKLDNAVKGWLGA